MTTDSSASGFHVTRDPAFTIVQLLEPETGEWQVRLEFDPEASETPNQFGNITAFIDHSELDLFMGLEPRLVEDHTQTVEVEFTSLYAVELLDLGTVEVMVTDPSGARTTYTAVQRADGGYTAQVDAAAFKGLHRVSLFVRSDSGTDHIPGDSFIAGGWDLSIPRFGLGMQKGFYVVNGDQETTSTTSTGRLAELSILCLGTQVLRRSETTGWTAPHRFFDRVRFVDATQS